MKELLQKLRLKAIELAVDKTGAKYITYEDPESDCLYYGVQLANEHIVVNIYGTNHELFSSCIITYEELEKAITDEAMQELHNPKTRTIKPRENE